MLFLSTKTACNLQHSKCYVFSMPAFTAHFKDSKAWPYLFPYAMVVAGFLFARLRGWGFWAMPVLIFGGIPLLDYFVGLDVSV